jgi:transposase
MEASGHARWFERLLGELRFELRIGDAAEIRTKRVRKQKTDRQDAQLMLRLLLEDRFPKVRVPNWENRDLRQLLWHRHRMVQARCARLTSWDLNRRIGVLYEWSVSWGSRKVAQPG